MSSPTTQPSTSHAGTRHARGSRRRRSSPHVHATSAATQRRPEGLAAAEDPRARPANASPFHENGPARAFARRASPRRSNETTTTSGSKVASLSRSERLNARMTAASTAARAPNSRATHAAVAAMQTLMRKAWRTRMPTGGMSTWSARYSGLKSAPSSEPSFPDERAAQLAGTYRTSRAEGAIGRRQTGAAPRPPRQARRAVSSAGVGGSVGYRLVTVG